MNKEMWTCGFDYNGQPFAAMATVKETDRMFILVKECDPHGDMLVRKALDYKKHIPKSENRLFETREAAIQAKIDSLSSECKELLARSDKILKKIEAVKGILA